MTLFCIVNHHRSCHGKPQKHNALDEGSLFQQLSLQLPTFQPVIQFTINSTSIDFTAWHLLSDTLELYSSVSQDNSERWACRYLPVLQVRKKKKFKIQKSFIFCNKLLFQPTQSYLPLLHKSSLLTSWISYSSFHSFAYAPTLEMPLFFFQIFLSTAQTKFRCFPSLTQTRPLPQDYLHFLPHMIFLWMSTVQNASNWAIQFYLGLFLKILREFFKKALQKV